jgi:DNA-binding beta-propeller fold protein YncE
MRNVGVVNVIGLFVVALGCGESGAGDGGPDTNTEGIDPTQFEGGAAGEGESTAMTGEAEPDTSNGDEDEDEDEGEPVPETKFDLSALPDAGNDCQLSTTALSYIWVANSTQGTISKINTTSMIEEGRYRVRPDSAGSPSRTSVNLSGDVAVANRLGGITKVYAQAADCQEQNGQPGIQTSSGSNDVLPWGQEECVAWHTPMDVTSQRPVAWDQGDFDEGACATVNAKVWTASSVGGLITVSRLNGDDGMIEDFTPIMGTTAGGYGPYGGAVDRNKDFWFIHRDSAPFPLVRVDADTLQYEIWLVPQPVNPYGFTIDPQGRPWIAGYQGGVARFDPADETWQINGDVTGVGMMSDGLGVVWIAHYPWGMEGVSALDMETMELLDFIAVPSSLGKGVSIDFNGYVWLVDMTNSAFRIDPETHGYEVYDGLTGPYTYSDMTGFGLASVSSPQG